MAHVEFWFPQIPQVNMRLIAIKENKYWNWKVGITRFEYVPKSLPCSGYSIFSFMCMFCRSLFVLLAIVLSVLLRFMDSDYPLVSSNYSLLIHHFGTYMYIPVAYLQSIHWAVRAVMTSNHMYSTDLIKQLNLLSKYLYWMPKEKKNKCQNQC